MSKSAEHRDENRILVGIRKTKMERSTAVQRHQAVQSTSNSPEDGVKRKRSLKKTFSTSWHAVKGSTRSKDAVSKIAARPVPTAVSSSQRKGPQRSNPSEPNSYQRQVRARSKDSNSSKARQSKPKHHAASLLKTSLTSSSTSASSKERDASFSVEMGHHSNYPYPLELELPLRLSNSVPQLPLTRSRQAETSNGISHSGALMSDHNSSRIASINQILYGNSGFLMNYERSVGYFLESPSRSRQQDRQRSKLRQPRRAKRRMPTIEEEEENGERRLCSGH